MTLETSIGAIRVTELSMLDWPEDAGSPPYRCKFVGVGAPWRTGGIDEAGRVLRAP